MYQIFGGCAWRGTRREASNNACGLFLICCRLLLMIYPVDDVRVRFRVRFLMMLFLDRRTLITAVQMAMKLGHALPLAMYVLAMRDSSPLLNRTPL